MTREEAIKIVQSATVWTDEEREALAMLIPELAESEDERIMKELIEYLTHRAEVTGFINEKEDCKKWITYLEKQKDLDKMIVVSPEVWDKAISDAFENGKREGEKQKEQKPSQTDAEKEYVRTLKSLISDFLHGKQEIDTGYYQQICDWLDGRHIEQKVLPGFDGLTPEEKMNHPLYLEGFDVGRNVQKVFDEQKPEWSEEDEDNLRRVTRIIEDNDSDWKELTAWLKSLRPQSHWKPSEEQMEAVQYVSQFDYGGHKATLVSLYEQLKKL